MIIAKSNTKQGSLDEKYQIEICNKVAIKVGLNLTNLPTAGARSFRGCQQSGDILHGSKVSLQSLKSFDGKIHGIKDGFICAKIIEGSGGFQDYQWNDPFSFCNWVKKFNH